MKKIIIMLISCFVISPVFATELNKGNYETRIETTFDLTSESDDDDSIPFITLGSLGYYFADNVQLGGFASFEKKNWESYWMESDVWTLGVFGEYNFDLGGAFIPYINLSAGFADGSENSGDTVFVGDIAAGVKIFVTETVAVSIQLKDSFSNDDVFDYRRTTATDGSGDNSDILASIGLRFLLR